MQLSEPEALPEADFLKFVKKGKEKGTLEKVAEASGIEKPDFLIDPEKHSEAVPDEVIDVDCLSNKTKEKLAEAELEKNVELSMEEMGFEKLAEAKEKLEKGELVNVDFLNSKDDRIPMNESLDDKVTEPMEETPKPCED